MNINTNASMQSNSSLKMRLPNGRTVELCSREGADTFLQTPRAVKNFFISNNSGLGCANKIREKSRNRNNGNGNGNGNKGGGKLNAGDKRQLTGIYFLIDSFSRYCSPALFEKKVSKEDIEFWLDHVIAELKEKTMDEHWQQTGDLEQHDAFILNPCISMFLHNKSVIVAFEKGFFDVLSTFIAARRAPLLPSADISDTICLLTSNALISLISNEGRPWSPEKVFKKFESSGLLAQYIRCSTVPQQHDFIYFPPGIDKFYTELTNCAPFLKKKFQKGQPCGDVILNILNGTDGHTTRKRGNIIQKIEAIATFVEILGMQENLKMCRKCNKSETNSEFQMSLKVCSRCQNVYYCSRECQVADWKEHKKQCVPKSKSEVKRSDTNQQIVSNFAQKHYPEIMLKVAKVCGGETGLDKSDVLVELDFKPPDDCTGTAPALRDPPVFKVQEACTYYEGSRPNEPDWFFKKEDKRSYYKNIKPVIAGLKDQHRRTTENHLLCFVRFSGGASCYRLQLQKPRNQTQESNFQMFGNEAVEAFQSAMQDNDFKLLSEICSEAQMMIVLQQLGAMPSENDLDRVR